MTVLVSIAIVVFSSKKRGKMERQTGGRTDKVDTRILSVLLYIQKTRTEEGIQGKKEGKEQGGEYNEEERRQKR